MRRKWEAVTFSRFLILPVIALISAGAQAASTGVFPQNSKPSAADTRTVRVCVAVMENRSGRSVSPVWERDQLVRELKRKGTERKSPIVLDVIALDGSSRESAGTEAADKKCDAFVLTTMVDPRRGPGASGGPDGIAPGPVVLGNAKVGQMLAIDFEILDVSDLRSIAEGTSTATVEENNDTRAADEAMRIAAHQIASELRKDRPTKID